MTTLLYDNFRIHICGSELEFPNEMDYDDIYIAGDESDCSKELPCEDCPFRVSSYQYKDCRAELSYLPNLFPTILDTNPELFI